MDASESSRRSFLKQVGAASALALTAVNGEAEAKVAPSEQQPPADDPAQAASRAKRMAWWHAARFGMFIHWGLYSVIGQHEWALEVEGIPIKQYELLAKQFHPKPNAARDWARLAKAAGQKYMVMTTKHHEGFCHWDTKLTDYCAPKQGPGRDLVREFVDAARAEGLRVGFYYSLMDWHHPDGARCKTDPEARKRFVEYTHGLVRELMTNYGKIDVLWYDVDWPLTAAEWESERMNKMVFELQPEIIVNNRNGLEGDFSTPEQEVKAEKSGRAWESCMTLNDSWGFNRGDDAWKTPKEVIANLVNCARGGGNYLLNIGPKPDGSIPEESVTVLTDGWQVAADQRQGHLRNRSRRIQLERECQLHAQRQHALHPSAVLAGAYTGCGWNAVLPARGGDCDWRTESQGEECAAAEDWRGREVHSG